MNVMGPRDQASKATEEQNQQFCTAMTPSWLQVVDGITEEWRVQMISLVTDDLVLHASATRIVLQHIT